MIYETIQCCDCGDSLQAVAVDYSPETGAVYEPVRCAACEAL